MQHFLFFLCAFLGLTTTAQPVALSNYEPLKQPRITVLKDQKLLVVEAMGDPNVIGGRAFGLLFQLYYGLPSATHGSPTASPRARWPQPLSTPANERVGLYALPLPDNASQLPPFQPQPGLTACITNWEYGDVAEMLHVGPYTREQPSLDRLKDFIHAQGYSIVGQGHEEEYISGPSPLGNGDPEQYLTILRYRVRKNGSNSQSMNHKS